ncbi:DUF4062 domain-containing protein [Acinetobacter baumannii]|nr:DUF4062 domain-containing protein [Acinetobacter baumannii]
MKKYQIFVSSTYVDLIEERQAAVEAILKSGHIPAGMELFTASNQSQWTIIQKWIDESDIYMLILGGRYGSIEPESGLSYTELEYNYALEKGKPLFAVVMKDEALDKKVQNHGRAVFESENPQKLKEFKAKVLSYMTSFFEDNKDIKLAVHESVGKLQQENRLVGWIRADEALNPQQYLDQITSLQNEKEELRKENNRLIKIKTRGDNTEDFDELLKILENEKVSLTRLQQENSTLPDETSLLTAFNTFKKEIIIGVVNNGYITTTGRFIFYDLAPYLQIHSLMHLEKVSSSSTVQRAIITEKGKNLLAHISRHSIKS